MRHIRQFVRLKSVSVLFVALAALGGARTGLAATPEALQAELRAAFVAAEKVMQRGPAKIKLQQQAVLALPAGHVFVPATEGNAILRAMGNHVSDTLLGLVFPGGEENGGWFVVVRYLPEGYIRDDDAKDWNADELMQSIKDGTEANNKERRERGMTEIDVIGWVEKPHYDAATHQLVWALSSRAKGSTSPSPEGANYNTYALGREGFISMNLITGYATIGAHKPNVKTLLTALHFNDGKRYADFNASTDKVAAYGLTALVAGVAAKKLGLLAAIGVFLLKFWKVLVLAAAGGGAVLFKRNRNRNTSGGSQPPTA